MSGPEQPQLSMPGDEQITAFADGPPRKGWLARLEIRTQLERLGVLVVVLLMWHLAVAREWVESTYAATPAQTVSSLAELAVDPLFWFDVAVTLREALGGWAIGATVGLVVGLVLGRWRHARKVLGPYLTFVNALPKVALAPTLILWFGIGEGSKVVLAALVVFFIVQVSTTSAMALADPDIDTVATTLGATEAQKFSKVYLPGILAAVFGALRLGAVFALLAVVIGEFLAARRGIGQRLIAATSQFAIDDAFALMIVLALLALAINGGIGLVERPYLRWQASGARGTVVSL